eukprot:3287107-Rhodomonas_salina.2
MSGSEIAEQVRAGGDFGALRLQLCEETAQVNPAGIRVELRPELTAPNGPVRQRTSRSDTDDAISLRAMCGTDAARGSAIGTAIACAAVLR